MEEVQLKNKELRQAVEDKENELQLSRQQSEAETSRIRIGNVLFIFFFVKLFVHLCLFCSWM